MRFQNAAGGSRRREHPREGGGDRPGGEDPGVEPAEVGEAFVDVRRRGELGVVEQPVDVPQHDGVGVEEHHPLVGELPQPELDEIVERRVEGRLLAFGEWGARVLLAARMGRVEGGGGRQEVAGGEAGLRGERGEGRAGHAAGREDDGVGGGAGAARGS